MYKNNQFDGNAAFSGGGFMPSQATQTADPSFSPAKNRDAQSLLTLTVKQISEAFQASDDKVNFLIDGVDVNNVKLLGMLHDKAERITDVSFVLDDGTGRIDCHRWVNEAVDTKEMELVLNGMYVKVHGHLKGFQGKKQLMVYSVRPVSDYNEIAYHFAECVYVHCHNTRLLKLQDAATAPTHTPNSAVNTPTKGFQPTPSNHFSVQYDMDGLKAIDKLVLDYLHQPPCLAREKGVHRNELVQQLNLPEHKIMYSLLCLCLCVCVYRTYSSLFFGSLNREAIESLESEGLVYSTIDEYHYKSTANG